MAMALAALHDTPVARHPGIAVADEFELL